MEPFDFHQPDAQRTGLRLRNRAARLHCEDLNSSLGHVLDLSVSGARVLYKGFRRLDERSRIDIRLSGYGNNLTVPARIARVRRLGMLTCEVGVEFIDPDPATRHILSEFVRCHSVRYAIVREAA